MEQITYSDFEKVDIRVGRVVEATPFPEARKPAYKLLIDFGPEIGMKRSSVQITEHYALDSLVGTLVCGVVNFPEKQIGPFFSQSLTVGFADADGKVVLVRPDQEVPLGSKLF